METKESMVEKTDRITEKGVREVFEALKRPGDDHWHKYKAYREAESWSMGIRTPEYHGFKCSCGSNHSHPDYFLDNPNFSTPEGAFWIMERLTDNLDIDIEFTRAGKRYYARITNSERHWFREANNFATALYSATLAWVKEK